MEEPTIFLVTMLFSSKTMLKNCLLLLKWQFYSCCFGLSGNQDFPELLQKSFITSTKLKKPKGSFTQAISTWHFRQATRFQTEIA